MAQLIQLMVFQVIVIFSVYFQNQYLCVYLLQTFCDIFIIFQSNPIVAHSLKEPMKGAFNECGNIGLVREIPKISHKV